MQDRKIIHIDMDAFYASVEQQDDKSLRGKAVIVGGNPQSRGVVAACSYEARKYGIHSAMPAVEAYKRCPYAIFVRPRFERYKEISNKIMSIFKTYTDKIEPLSLDEAYLDVTENKKNISSAYKIAILIKEEIKKETGLTASAGVSYNKFLAKIASDYNKPNGIKLITPDESDELLEALEINRFFGIGKVTQKLLISRGIKTGKELKAMDIYELEKIFKGRAYTYYEYARGIDNREER